jgi:hypothetical protein
MYQYAPSNDRLKEGILSGRVAELIHLIRIQHFRLNADPDSDPIRTQIRIQFQSGSRVMMIKIEKNLQLNFFFDQKLLPYRIYQSLGLQKERPSYRRSLQLSKENTGTSKHEISKFFSTFVGYFALLDPDPDSESGSRSTDPIESGSNSDPDPDPQLC